MLTEQDRADEEQDRRTRIAEAEAQDAAQWEYDEWLMTQRTILEYPTLTDVEPRNATA